MASLLIEKALKDINLKLPVKDCDGFPCETTGDVAEEIFTDLDYLIHGRPLRYVFDQLTGTCVDIPNIAVRLGWMELDRDNVLFRLDEKLGCPDDKAKYFKLTDPGRNIWEAARVPEYWSKP
jgi:hypothetical protein